MNAATHCSRVSVTLSMILTARKQGFVAAGIQDPGGFSTAKSPTKCVARIRRATNLSLAARRNIQTFVTTQRGTLEERVIAKRGEKNAVEKENATARKTKIAALTAAAVVPRTTLVVHIGITVVRRMKVSALPLPVYAKKARECW